jgi:hypothetical protein
MLTYALVFSVECIVELSVEIGFRRGMPVIDSQNFDKIGPLTQARMRP